jgi:hypothetical protein
MYSYSLYYTRNPSFLGEAIYQYVNQSMIKIQVSTKFIVTHLSPFEFTLYIFQFSIILLKILFPEIFRSLKNSNHSQIYCALNVPRKKRECKCTKIFRFRRNSLSHTVSTFEYRLYNYIFPCLD